MNVVKKYLKLTDPPDKTITIKKLFYDTYDGYQKLKAALLDHNDVDVFDDKAEFLLTI